MERGVEVSFGFGRGEQGEATDGRRRGYVGFLHSLQCNHRPWDLPNEGGSGASGEWATTTFSTELWVPPIVFLYDGYKERG